MVAKQHASSSLSLAAELLHKMSPMPYKMYVAKINECDAVTPENFKNSRWVNFFTIDSSNIMKNGHANLTMSLTYSVHSVDIWEQKFVSNCLKI